MKTLYMFGVTASHHSTSHNWLDLGNLAALSAAALATLFIGYLQLRKPQPRLLYSIHKPPFKQLRQLTKAGLFQIEGSEGPVTDPYLLDIALECQVTDGIDKDYFNDGNPIRFDVGAPIQSRGKASKPPEQPCPKTSLDGNIFKVGPDYFMNGQIVTYTLVLDGAPRSRILATSPFHKLRLKRTYWAG